MSVYIDAPQEEAFNYLMDFYTGRRMRILTSNSPYHIKTEFGSWFSFAMQGNTKGDLETQITKRNGGSYLHLNFSFMKEYVTGLAVALIGAILIFFFGVSIANTMLSNLPSQAVGDYWTTVYIVIALASALVVAFSMIGESYAISRTKERILKELNTFLESLPSRKK